MNRCEITTFFVTLQPEFKVILIETMEKKYVVGVDVGGTTSKIGVVNARGEILAQSVIKTEKNVTAEEFIHSLAEAVKANIFKAGVEEAEIRGVGVGAPNANYYTGVIAHAPNLTWASDCVVEFSKMLQEELGGMPVSLTNDANAAAVGEMTYGIAKGKKNFINIALGTGVGSGIVVNGSVLYGSDGFAGELGHTCAVRHNGRLCGCGKSGCLEAYCSATGVARTAREWLDATAEDSLLRKCEVITSKDVYDAAKQGDALALRIFDFTGRILGEKLADFIEFSAPEAIVLFGGLARSREFLEAPVLKAMNENVLPLWRGKVELLFSSLQESDAAILGASALAWEL